MIRRTSSVNDPFGLEKLLEFLTDKGWPIVRYDELGPPRVANVCLSFLIVVAAKVELVMWASIHILDASAITSSIFPITGPVYMDSGPGLLRV